MGKKYTKQRFCVPGWFWGSISALLVAPAAFILAVYLYEIVTWRADPVNDMFMTHCGRCHTYDRPRRYAKSPHEWRSTVERMLVHKPSNSPIKAEIATRKAIADLLIRHRSADGPALFRFRCARCHDRELIDAYLHLPEDALIMMIHRHVRENNFAVHVWEGELILNEILHRKQKSSPAVDERNVAEPITFERDCGLCHTISFRYRRMWQPPRSDEAWSDIISRMQSKTPEYFQKEDLPILQKYLQRKRDLD